MQRPSLGGRATRIAIAAVLGLLLGVGAFYGWQVASAPGLRPAPGWTGLTQVLVTLP